MGQLICTFPSRILYWYEVGMLKVPAKYSVSTIGFGRDKKVSVVAMIYSCCIIIRESKGGGSFDK